MSQANEPHIVDRLEIDELRKKAKEDILAKYVFAPCSLVLDYQIDQIFVLFVPTNLKDIRVFESIPKSHDTISVVSRVYYTFGRV